MEDYYITPTEIAEILQMKYGTGCKVIRELNKELKEQGYMTRQGRVPRRYFLERYGLVEVTK